MNRYFSFLVVLTFPLIVCGEERVSASQCVIAEDAMRRASEIRALAIQKPVPCYVHDKNQVREFLLTAISEKLPANRLRDESLLYEALGVIPSGYDYKNGIIALYLDQLGGYYDPEKDHFVMAGWLPASFQTSIAVHELTHALQDQYYDLGRLIDPRTYTSDQLLARSALVEGDATAVMLDYARGLSGLKPIRLEQSVDSVILQNVIGSGFMKSLATVPQSLYSALIFPYTSGLRFVHHHLKEEGYAGIDKILKSPPRTTEEILHPEKYLANGEFQEIQEDSVSSFGVSSTIYSDVMGEFGVSLALMLWVPDKSEVAQAAAGWAGDRAFLVNENEAAWITRWDTEADRNQFFNLLKRSIQVRYPKVRVTEHEWNRHEFTGEGIRITIAVDSLDVRYHWRRLRK